MSLNFSNLINYKELKNYPYPVKIKGDCTITNYKGSKSSVPNPFTITKKDDKVTVKGFAEQLLKDIHGSLEVFAKIAAMDGNAEELSAEDLKLARQDFGSNKSIWESLGVTSFRYDPGEDVANLKIGEQTLRIDFDSKTDKHSDAKATSQNQNKSNNNAKAQVTQIVQTSKPVLKSAETKPVQKKQTVKQSARKTLDKYAGIPKKWIPHIKNTAAKWGYTEELIISIALSEGYTPVAKHKDEGGKGGLWEVGFGHTTRANHNNKFGKNFNISLQRAFDWLGQDIKDKEEKIKEFGSFYNYNNIPQPLQEMMIDIAFNRGEARLNPKLKLSEEEKKNGKKQKFDDHYSSVIANIGIKSWGSAAVRLRQEEFSASIKRQGKEAGLRKRNVQRFLRLMIDPKSKLTPEKIVVAMDLFNREYYYTKTLNMLNETEADSLRHQWNNIYYRAKAKCSK